MKTARKNHDATAYVLLFLPMQVQHEVHCRVYMHDILIKSYGNTSYNSWCTAETSKAVSFLFPRDHAFLFHVLTLMIYSCLGSVSSTTMNIHFKTSESTIRIFSVFLHKSTTERRWRMLGRYILMHKPLPINTNLGVN